MSISTSSASSACASSIPIKLPITLNHSHSHSHNHSQKPQLSSPSDSPISSISDISLLLTPAASLPSSPLKQSTTLPVPSTLSLLVASLPSLPKEKQDSLASSLKRIERYPDGLPLSDEWSMYYSDSSTHDKKLRKGGSAAIQYAHGLMPLYKCSSCSTFASNTKALKHALGAGLCAMPTDTNLHFFKSHIVPVWEDSINKNGGRLTFPVKREEIDISFGKLLLVLAGASAESEDGVISGIVASRRARGDRIELWLAPATGKREVSEPYLAHVRKILKDEGIDAALSVKWKSHF